MWIKIKALVPVVLVVSGFGSSFSNCILILSIKLIVDFYISKVSIGTGCLNLFRYSPSDKFISCLCLPGMSNKMTYGIVFIFVGGVSATAFSLLYNLVGKYNKLIFNRRKEEMELIRTFREASEEHKIGIRLKYNE